MRSMSLRTRIVLLFVGLLGVLTAAELWLAHALTQELSLEVGRVAEQVGQSVVRVIGDSDRSPGDTPAPADVVVSRDPDSGDLVILTSGDETRDGDGAESITLTMGERRSVITLERPVQLEVPRGGVETALDQFTRRLVLGSAGLLGLALGVAAVGAHRLTRPLRCFGLGVC
jgi:hypothetical protein